MKKVIQDIIAGIILLLVAHMLMVTIHEFTHSFIAWMFGFKQSPFHFNFADYTLFLLDDQTDYKAMLAQNRNILAAMTAITPNIINASLYVISAILCNSKKIQEKVYLYSFFFWFMIVNIGQVYSYILWRTFETHGDVSIFLEGLNISPYWLFIPGIIFIIFSVYNILKHQILRAYKTLKISHVWTQAIFLFFVILILFGYYGGLLYNILNKKYFYLIYPTLLIILFYMICFPKNRWVQRKLHEME
ncbi:MAG: hypothetical protein K1060chlam4_00745 [Candidatus Anoxychlamydiales bacterium]|nr:hypothetical protein [Candidatus Anoxychlamydiales bacterium]